MSTLPIVFLACKVFEGIVGGKKENSNIFLDYGLHSVPKQLKETVQEQINAVQEPSIVVLGYGLCGNGLNGIRSGKHTLVIPKVDDCVAMFMGSRQRYMDQFNQRPGSYYLTKGWFEVGSDPLSEYERLVEKYGLETADYLMKMQYQHYKYLVFVSHSQDDIDAYRPRALKVAAYCERFGIVYDEYLGSEEFINQIDKVLNTTQENTSSDFIVIQPGNTLTQGQFQ